MANQQQHKTKMAKNSQLRQMGFDDTHELNLCNLYCNILMRLLQNNKWRTKKQEKDVDFELLWHKTKTKNIKPIIL